MSVKLFKNEIVIEREGGTEMEIAAIFVEIIFNNKSSVNHGIDLRLKRNALFAINNQ